MQRAHCVIRVWPIGKGACANIAYGVRQCDLFDHWVWPNGLIPAKIRDTDDSVAVDLRRNGDVAFVAGVGCDLNGVPGDEAIAVAITRIAWELFLSDCAYCDAEDQQQADSQHAA